LKFILIALKTCEIFKIALKGRNFILNASIYTQTTK